jgi:hypothetical protein
MAKFLKTQDFLYLVSRPMGLETIQVTESAYFVSLMFCVLDNNIRNFKCVLSGAGFQLKKWLSLWGGVSLESGRIIRPGAG